MLAYRKCTGGTIHLIKVPPQYKKEVAKQTKDTLKNASKLLAYKPLAGVVIFSSGPEFVIPEIGIGAHALIQGDIVVNIDFSRKDTKKILEKELPSTLYHEFSHVVRKASHSNLYETLIESLITEGIASYIEKKVFKKRVPYIEPIKNEQGYWAKMKRNMRKKRYNHAEWFFGTGTLPRWIGYRLGYLLVHSFMKQQKNLSLDQLVRVKSDEVLI